MPKIDTYTQFISKQQSDLRGSGKINEVKYPEGSPHDIPIQPKSFYDNKFHKLVNSGVPHGEAHKQTLDYIKKEFPKQGDEYADMLHKRYKHKVNLGDFI